MLLTITTNNDSLKLNFCFDNSDSLDEKEDAMQWIKNNGCGDDTFFDFCDHFLLTNNPFCNGWSFGNGNQYPIGLTEAPFITDGSLYDDDGNFNIDKQTIWYYLDYAIKDFLEVLITTGEVSFTKLKKPLIN